MVLKVLFLVVFFAMMVAIGFYYRKSTADVKGFVLGGCNVGPWLTAFAYGTSYFSAVIFVGYAGQFGWRFGVASTWIGIGNALIGSLLAWSLRGACSDGVLALCPSISAAPPCPNFSASGLTARG